MAEELTWVTDESEQIEVIMRIGSRAEDGHLFVLANAEKVCDIVRCKDCEFYTAEEKWCRRLGLCGAFDENGYCSHGERKDNG